MSDRIRPAQPVIPSKRRSHRTPYSPAAGMQADVASFPPLQRPHEHGYGGPPPVWVASTYDARPINAVDFQAQSGGNALDTGANPFPTGNIASLTTYNESSMFYDVPVGRVAVVRDFHLLIVPFQGERVQVDEVPTFENPIFASNGASNFRVVISFLVNGVFQQGVAGVVSWAGAFGDIFGECYFIAPEQSQIEMRVTAAANGSRWNQALMSMHGNLLMDKGYQIQFAPGTDITLPVHETAVESVAVQGG